MNNEDGKIWYGIGLDNAQLRKDRDESKRIFKTIGDSAVSEGARIDATFKKIAGGIAAVFSAQQGMELLKTIVRVRAEFQKYEAVLTNTLGSQVLAAEAMNLIKDIAASTPFGVDQLTESYIKLVNQGFTPTRDMIISLGDLAASQGKSFDQLTEAIIDAQTGEFERLKEFGIRASKEGDKVTFMFKEQATTVDFAAASIRDYILSLGEMEGVAGGMEAISKTIGGQISNLEDAIQSMFNEIGQANEGVISDAVSAAAFLVEHYEEVGKILLVLVTTYGVYRTAVILATAATKGYTLAQMLNYHWLLLVERAQKLLNATMLANPYVAAATALAAIVASLIIFSDNADEASKAQDRLNDALDKHQQDVAVTKGKIKDLVKAINDENLSNEIRSGKLRELQRLTDGRLNQLTLESFKTKEATDAIKEYVAALDAEAKMKAYQSVKEDNYRKIAEIETKERERAKKFAEDNFDTPWYKQLFGFRGFKDQQVLANVGGDSEEKKAREEQNKDIDEMIKASLDAQNKRSAANKQEIIKNKEYYENLKKDAQARLDALSDVEAAGVKGKGIIAEIQGYDKILSSYSVGAANKADSKAAKDALADQKKTQQELKQLNEQREALAKQTNERLEDIRIDRLEGLEKDKAVIQREYDQMVAEYEKLGILNEKTRAVLDKWKSGALANATNAYSKKDSEDQKEWVQNALNDYGSYEQQKLNIAKKFEDERKKAITAGRLDLVAALNAAEQEELNSLKAANSDKLANMKQFADGAVYLTKKAVQQQIEILQNLLKTGDISDTVKTEIQKKIDGLNGLLGKPDSSLVDSQLDSEIAKKEAALLKLAQSGDVSSDAFHRLNDELMRLREEKASESLNDIQKALSFIAKLAPELSQLSEALKDTGNNALSQIGGVFANLAGGAGDLLETFKKIETEGVSSMDAYAAAASFIISTISNIISSAKAQKQAYEEFYLQNLAYQHDYNNALIDEIRLREGIKNTVFFNDYAGKINAGLAAEIESVKRYNEALSKLQDAQVITGTKKVRDWGAVAASTLSGAATGAIAGSGAAGIGAIPGAIIGAAVGFIGSMLKKRQVVNVYDGLLKTYPKLIDEQGNLNKAMAEAIISSGKIEGSSRENLQYLISMNEQYEKAKQQIESVISDLAGSLGNDLMSSLFDDWAKGGDNVGKAFSDGVSKSLANIGKNLLFNSVFGDDFVALQEKIKQGFKTTGDPASMITALLDFNNEAAKKGAEYQSLLDEYAKQLKEKGIEDVFGLINEETRKRQGSSKGFESMSQDSANELNGRFTTIQGHTYQMNENLKLMSPLTQTVTEIKASFLILQERSAQALIHLSNIDTNTKRLETIEGDMSSVKDNIRSVKTSLDDINLKGIKIKT